MNNNIKKWIWQHNDYPNFKYDKTKLTPLINEIEYKRGLLDGISTLFSQDDIRNIEIDTLTVKCKLKMYQSAEQICTT